MKDPSSARRLFTVTQVLAATVLAVPLAGARQPPTLTLNAGIHVVRAEIANTYDARALGLMHRKSLPTNHGMLFIFPELQRHCMWMKNTFVPLSVAFIDEDGVIRNIEDMYPQSESSHCAVAPVRYALEMNRGWFAVKGIAPGSKIVGLDKAPPPN